MAEVPDEVPRDDNVAKVPIISDAPEPELDTANLTYGLSVDDASSNLFDYDVVAVHGLSGGSKSTWPGAPERWDWIKYRFFDTNTVRVIQYDYDVDEPTGTIYTRKGLRDEAFKLLDALLALRESQEQQSLAKEESGGDINLSRNSVSNGLPHMPKKEANDDEKVNEGTRNEEVPEHPSNQVADEASDKDELEVTSGRGGPVSEDGENETQDVSRRPLIFVSQDLGGIIIKEALILATLNPLKYGKILQSTMSLIFFGCPHRCHSATDMEEGILRLLSFYVKPSGHNGLRVVKGLSDSIIEINSSFIDTKLLVRLNTANVYSTEDHIFDKFTSTMNIPFENRVTATRTHDEGVRGSDDFQKTLGEHLGRIPSPMEYSSSLRRYLPIILSQASPIYPLTTTNDDSVYRNPEVSWLEKDETLLEWMARNDASILQVHGKENITRSSEFLFHFIDSKINSLTDQSVLYFQFRKQDDRFNNIQTMLRTFLAQIMSHYTNLDDWVIWGFDQLNKNGNWSDRDLFDFWVGLRASLHLGNITYIIVGIELCDDSKDWFLDELVSSMARSEARLKIIITGKGTQDVLKNFPSINLEQNSKVDTAKRDAALDGVVNFEIKQLFQRYPHYSAIEQMLKEVLSKCGDDYRKRRLIIDFLNYVNNFEKRSTTKRRLATLSSVSLSNVVSMILDSIPLGRKRWAHMLVGWLLCAVRPLTLREMRFALLLGADEDIDLEDTIFPNLKMEIEAHFGTMVYFLDEEIGLGHPDLKDIFAETTSPAIDPRYSNHGSIHEEIAITCLRYLSQPIAQRKASEFIEQNLNMTEHPIIEDRFDLLFYAVRHWPYHYELALSDGVESPALAAAITKFLEDVSARDAWIGVYHLFSSPTVVTSPKRFSYISVLSTLGLSSRISHYIETEDPRQHEDSFDGDCSAALIEAARNGCLEVVQILLKHSEPTKSDLRDAIAVATPNTMQELLEHSYTSVGSFDFIGGDGRTDALCKAAWLGLTDVVRYLIKSGADINPKGCKDDGTLPLRLAARNNHVECAKLLLAEDTTSEIRENILEMVSIRGHSNIAQLFASDESAKAISASESQERMSWGPLQLACEHGHHRIVKILLDAGADANLAAEKGTEPLIVALEKSHLECCRVLLKHGAAAEPSADDSNIKSPLFLAVQEKLLDICKLLLEKGANPNKKHDYETPILHLAVQQGSIEIVKELLKRDDMDLSQVDDNSYIKSSPLSRACEKGQKEMVSFLIEKGAKIDFSGSSMSTPIYIAAREGHEEIIELLAEAGADVNASDDNNWGPLHIAYDYPRVTQALLKRAADINALSEDGTPLFLSTRYNFPEVVKVLLEYKPNLEIALDKAGFLNGMTPLAVAAERNNAVIARLLLEAGANVNAAATNGWSPVALALSRSGDSYESQEILRTILEYNPSLTTLDQDGDTALHCLNQETPVTAIKLLVNAGADIEIANEMGHTALSTAVLRENTEVVKYLLSKKARVDVANAKRGNIMHIACSWSNLATIKLLLENDPPANVNEALPGLKGTPLQCVCYRDHTDEVLPEMILEIATYLLDEGKADINLFGGQFGTALHVACLKGSPELLKLLLDHEARVDINDELDRKPLHIACFRTVEHIDLILDSVEFVASRDKLQRTPLHYAVMSGRLDTVKKILELAPECLDASDADGWTPLLWVARKCGRWYTQEDDIPKIIELLITRGADLWVRGEGLDREWSPLKVARYYGADQEILDLLTPKTRERTIDGRTEIWDDRFHLSRKTSLKETGFCDACLLMLAGKFWVCQNCIDQCLCFKCYRSRDTLHDTSHLFEEEGEEYEADPEISPDRRASVPFDDGATVLSLDEEDSEDSQVGEDDEETVESLHNGVNGVDDESEEEEEDD